MGQKLKLVTTILAAAFAIAAVAFIVNQTTSQNSEEATSLAVTGDATAITDTGATLNGVVYPHRGTSGSYRFQYGPTGAYGQSTPRVVYHDRRSRTVYTPAVPITGLTAGTGYHFRLIVTTVDGTASGGDQTFTTTGGVTTTTTTSTTPTTTTSTTPTTTTSTTSTTTTNPPPPGLYNTLVEADHPVAYYGSWLLRDVVGGHNPTAVGGTPGVLNLPDGEQAWRFNGNGQYLTVPSDPVFSIPTTHQLTWEAWVNLDALNFSQDAGDNNVDPMGKCAIYSPTCEWEFRIYKTTTPRESPNRPNRISAYVFNPAAGLGSAADWQPGGANYPASQDMIKAGHWVHVVGEYQTLTTPAGCSTASPGSINIWVNGIEQNFASHTPTGCMSQYSIKPTANNSPFDIGTMAPGDNATFQGGIGKVAIYDSLLSPAQIDAHYTAMTGLTPSGSCAATCTLTGAQP